MVSKQSVLSGLAVIGLSLSLALMLVGVIGVQVTSQANLERALFTVMSGEQGGQDHLASLYGDLGLYCMFFPHGAITREVGGLPFTVNCTDISGLDLQGFSEYFVGTFSGLLWRGELSWAELGGGWGEDGSGFGFLHLFTERGNALFFGLAALAILPVAGTGAAVLHMTPPGRRLRRVGVSLTGDGIGGLVVTALIFAMLPSMLPVSGEGALNVGALLDIFSGSVYATLAAVLAAGLVLVTIHLAQWYLTGRPKRGENP